MLVREWMTRMVVTVSPHMSVLNARRLLAHHGVRHLPVVVGDEVIGMVSDRDLRMGESTVASALAGLQSDLVSGRYRRVETVMSAPVHCVSPTDTVRHAAVEMLDRRISALPVVEHGRLVGIIGLTDCVRALIAGDEAADTRSASGDTVVVLPSGARGDAAERREAVVVDANPSRRLRTRNELVEMGYVVQTCPGPTGGAFCPAERGAGFTCARVSADTELVVIDPGSASPELVATYHRWLPEAAIRVGEQPLAASVGPARS